MKAKGKTKTYRGNKMTAWNVYLHGRKIDTVYFAASCTRDYVLDSLVNHDGYNPNIEIS
jgi:hypothetical protein